MKALAAGAPECDRRGRATLVVAAIVAGSLSGCGRYGYALLGGDGGTVGPDTPETLISASSGNARRPALAFAGDGYLLTWDDDRGTGSEIFAARIGAAGAKVGADVPVSSTGGASCCTAVAWGAPSLGVAWEGPQEGIFFTRLGADGVPLGAPIQVSGAQPMAYNVAVAASGVGFGVSWDNASATQIGLWCASVTAAGTGASAPVRLNSVTTDSIFPTIVWTGSEYGVAWEDGRAGARAEMYFARCSVDGAALGTDVQESDGAGTAHFGSIAWSGDHYGLAWEDDRDGSGGMYFARLDAQGAKLGADVKVSSGLSGNAREASLVWASDRFGLAWVQGNQVMLAQLDAGGALLGTPRVVAGNGTAAAQDPSLVWAGSTYGLAWEDQRAGNWAIYFRALAP